MTNQERNKFVWQLLDLHHSQYCTEYFNHFDKVKFLQLPNALATMSDNQNEAVNYHQYLLALSETELNLEYEKNLAILIEEYEKGHEFNSEPAIISSQVIEFYSRAEYWTLGEAAALINGRNPKIVGYERIMYDNSNTIIAVKLKDTLELLKRAKDMVSLFHYNSPMSVIGWATLKEFNLPPALVEAVRKLGRDRTDVSKENTDLKDQVTALQNKISELTKEKPKAAKQPSPKERESLLKFILGVAITGYGYDPKATKSSEIKKIAGDLQLAGLELDEDTVRKYLNEAKALFADVITEQKG